MIPNLPAPFSWPRCSPILLCALVQVSCSAEAYRHDADEEVYEILAVKRAPALGTGTAAVGFEVEAREDSLRTRLLERIQQGERPTVRITLADALTIAAENSRQFQDQKERLYLAALSLTGQRNRYSLFFRGGNDTAVSGIGDDSADGNTRNSISASKILSSGASILGSFVNTFFRSFTSGGRWNASSLLSLSITQPLLRGFGSEVALEPLTQAERDAVYAIRTYERFRRTFCVDVVTDYLRLLEQQNNLLNATNNTSSLASNRERSKALADAGRLPKFQLDQARQSELSAQDSEVTTRARLETTLDRFKVTLGLPIAIDLVLDGSVVDRLEELGVGALELTEDDAVELALANRLDLMNATGRVVDADRQSRVAADALKMGLDLSVAVDVPNERPEKAFKLNWHRLDWQVGVAIDLPLNRVAERNVYRQSLISLAAERRTHSLLADNITLGIRSSLRDVRAALSNYRIRERSVDLAKERVDSTRLLIDAGRADQRDFLEAQDALVRAENAVISALVDYVVSKLGLLRDLELLDVGASGLELDLRILRKWLGDEAAKDEEKADEAEKAKKGD